MGHRCVAGGVALAVGLAMIQLGTVPVASQSSAPTTAWGEPDLQGIWTDEYQTPLQRPPQFADREFFTDEERAGLDKRRAWRFWGVISAGSWGLKKTSPAPTTPYFQSGVRPAHARR